jgi:hypothetical protein
MRPALLDPVQALASDPRAAAILRDCHAALADDLLLPDAGRRAFTRYLDDVFIYTLEHALKQACQQVGGVESLSRIAGWADLQMDFPGAAGRITIYELGTGGIGIMRAVQRVFAERPALFWHIVEAQATECETHALEEFGRALLALPEETLVALDRRVRDATLNADPAAAEAIVQEIGAEFRTRYGVALIPAHFRLLTRIFAEPIHLKEGGEIASWQLYREINIARWDALARELGRAPTLTEARYAIAREIEREDAVGTPAGSSLHLLYHTLRRMPVPPAANPEIADADEEADDAPPDTVMRALERQIAQRLLASCADVCAQCLIDPSCTLTDPARQPLLLSRRLLRAFLRDRSDDAAVDLAGMADVTEATAALMQRLERDGAARVRYRARHVPLLVTVMANLADATILPAGGGTLGLPVRPVGARTIALTLDTNGPRYEVEFALWDETPAVVPDPYPDAASWRRATAAWEMVLLREIVLARFGASDAPLYVVAPRFAGPPGCDEERDTPAGMLRPLQLAFRDFTHPRPLQPWTLADATTVLLAASRPVRALLGRTTDAAAIATLDDLLAAGGEGFAVRLEADLPLEMRLIGTEIALVVAADGTVTCIRDAATLGSMRAAAEARFVPGCPGVLTLDTAQEMA